MTCSNHLRAEGKAYPRTCADCGLGPCKYRMKCGSCAGTGQVYNMVTGNSGACPLCQGLGYLLRFVSAGDPAHISHAPAGMKTLLSEAKMEMRLAAFDDNDIQNFVNELREVAIEYAGAQQLRERIVEVVLRNCGRGTLEG